MQGDNTLIIRAFTDALESPAVVEGLPSKAMEQIRKSVEFFEAGLFDGVYREMQRWALENMIIPWVRRTNPNATPRQVAAQAAEAVNMMFSTVGEWQRMLNHPQFRAILHTVAFSASENEGLLRGFARAIALPPGKKISIRGKTFEDHPSAGMFREFYLGIFIGFAILANVVNVVATGKGLPLESYNPIDFDDPYAPFGVGYNNRFLSPQMPFIRGRNDSPIYIDIVGQMDTAFRWLFDPPGAIAARVNVFPRAIMNQLKGETFFGETVEGWKRPILAVLDLFAPIGPSAALGALAEALPPLRDFIPEGESGLGVSGQLLQLVINARAEKTKDLLNRGSQKMYAVKYDDIEPYQRDRVQDAHSRELDRRRETGIEREQGLYFAATWKIDKEFDEKMQFLAANKYKPVRKNGATVIITRAFIENTYHSAVRTATAKKAQAAEDFEIDFDEPDPNEPDPNKRALNGWYDLFDQAEVSPGVLSTKLLNDLRARHLNNLGREQVLYVLRNTNRRKLPESIKEALQATSTGRRIAASDSAREDHTPYKPQRAFGR